MPAISFLDISKSYEGSPRPAVDGVSLDVSEGEFVVFLGPSGCGKTTLLKMTNRLIEPTAGSIEVNGEDIRSLRVTDLRRRMGYVIQQVGLFPHLTVAANIAVVPKLLHWNGKKIQQRTDELLELVGLDPAQYRKRYPRQLSGGQQQRVGLARALAADPGIMLMDEPFGAIDAITRNRLQDQLLLIQRRVRKAVLFVTHDVDEALRLADKLVIMREGKVVQHDTPVNVLTEPSDDFVRELLNTDDVLREMSLITAAMALERGTPLSSVPTIPCDHNLREALSLMIASNCDEVSVVDEEGAHLGKLTMQGIRTIGTRTKAEPAGAVLKA